MVLLSSETNVLTPLHKLLYLIFHVQGPATKKTPVGEDIGWKMESRIVLERLLELLRVLFVIFILAVHISFNSPPTLLPVNTDMSVGDSIGVCHLFAGLRTCQPTYLTFESAVLGLSKDSVAKKLNNRRNPIYRFSLYNGSAVLSHYDVHQGRQWVRSQCALETAVKTAEIKPVWSLDVGIDATSANRAAWKSFCESATDAASTLSDYPASPDDSSTSEQLCQCNITTTRLDPLNWGSECRVVSRLSRNGLLQVLLVNVERQQEMVLWKTSATATCDFDDETSTAGGLVISANNTIAAAVKCSHNKLVALS